MKCWSEKWGTGTGLKIGGKWPVTPECVRGKTARRSGAFKGSNRRLEFELGAWFEGFCGFALVLALSQMREHGLGPFGRAGLHPRRNPLDRQGRFAPQPVGNSLKKSPVDLQPPTTIQ